MSSLKQLFKNYLPLLLSSSLAIYFLIVSISYTYFGVDVSANDHGEVIVKSVNENGEAFKNGLKKNDIIVTVNGEKAAEHFTIKKFRIVEQVSHIEYKRENVIKHLTNSNQYTTEAAFYYLIAPSLVILLCLFLSFIVIRSGEKSNTNRYLLFFLLLLGVGYISSFPSGKGDLIARITSSFTFILTPVILLNLFISFFNDLHIKTNWRTIIKVFYILAFLFTGIMTIHELSNWHNPLINDAQLAFVIVIAAFIIYTLASTYMSQRNSNTKSTIKVLLAGMILSISPFLFLHSLPYILFETSLINPEFALIFIVILPLTFLYLIQKERIIDIDYILYWLKRDFLFSLFGGLLFLAFALLNNLDKPILSSMSVIAICLFIFSFKNQLFMKSDSMFHHSPLRFQQQLNHYFDKAMRVNASSKLLQTIMDEVQRVIPEIKTVHHFTFDKSSNEVSVQEDCNNKLIEPYTHLLASNTIGSITDFKNGFCILIHEKENTSLYLFCSHKANRTSLNPVEKIWIELLAKYSNILLENQFTIDDVVQQLSNLKDGDAHHSKWLSKLLSSISEKERVHLATDIHDSVLQELFLVNNELAAALNEPMSKEVSAKLYKTKELVLDCIYTTRETCNELFPPLLVEFGLKKAIEHLISKVHLTTNYEVFFRCDEFDDTSLTEEQMITLYRIIQELFTNARKHSKADEVTLIMKNNNHRITIFYSDNGIGMDLLDVDENYQRFSGLIGIRERVRSFDGEMKLHSESGLQMTIHLVMGKDKAQEEG